MPPTPYATEYPNAHTFPSAAAERQTPNAIRYHALALPAFNSSFSPLVRLFPRASGITSLPRIGVLLAFMPNQHLWGIARDEPAHGDQKKRKQSNWIRSIVAGAGMLAVSSLGAVLVFDWYFFSVVDELSTSLQPIAVVFRQPEPFFTGWGI